VEGAFWARQIEIRSAAGTSEQRCDEKGLCLIEGALTELPIEIRASDRDWLPSAWVTIDSPGSETTLVLRRGTALEGSLLLPRGAHLDDLELALHVEAGDSTQEAPRVGTDVTGDRFRFGPCEPGRARLTVSHDDRVVLERSPIELVAGQTTELEPIDLRELLHPFVLTFELESGAPWRGGHLEVREPDGELSTWTTIDPSGRASFLSMRTSVDVWVAGHGARAQLFEGVLDGDHLTLPPAPAVRLQLAKDVHAPAPPLVLIVRTERARPETVAFETDDDIDLEEAVVGESGSARLEESWPGDYALTWFVRHTGTGVEFPVTQAERQTVSIPDTAVAPLVEARLTRDELARAVLGAGG